MYSECCRVILSFVPIFHSVRFHLFAEKNDGSWSGMVGQLVRKEADVCAGALNFTPRRSKVIDFGTSILDDKGTNSFNICS